MGKTNENYVKILPEDNKTVIQDKLFKIFSKIYTNLEKEKFQLYQMNESDSPSLYADDYNFLYNIHYSGKSIKFEKLTDKFWKIECAGFSSTMVNLESKYWPSAIYLYSNETGKIACYTERQMFDIDVLFDENFKINNDGTSNYVELYKKSIKDKEEKERIAAESEQLKIKQEEEKRKKEIEELRKKEDNCTVTESAIIKFDYYSNLNENVIKKEINNIVENDFKHVDINIERISFYNKNSEHYYNNEASLHVIFKSEQSYPFTTVKNKINNLDVELSGLILHDNFEVDYNTKRFETEKEAQDYVEIIRKREDKQKEILDNQTKENENQTESFDMVDQLDQEDDYISDTLKSDDETEVQELVDVDEPETNILESEKKEEYEFKTEKGKLLNEKRKKLLDFIKKNNLKMNEEKGIEFSYGKFDVHIKKDEKFDVVKMIDIFETEKFNIDYSYNYYDEINISVSIDSLAFAEIDGEKKEHSFKSPLSLQIKEYTSHDNCDDKNIDDELINSEEIQLISESEKYLMLQNFLQKEKYTILHKIDIFWGYFEFAIENDKNFKNTMEVKKHFEEYDFRVTCVQYRDYRYKNYCRPIIFDKDKYLKDGKEMFIIRVDQDSKFFLNLDHLEDKSNESEYDSFELPDKNTYKINVKRTCYHFAIILLICTSLSFIFFKYGSEIYKRNKLRKAVKEYYLNQENPKLEYEERITENKDEDM